MSLTEDAAIRLTHGYWVEMALGHGPNSRMAKFEKRAAEDFINWVAMQVAQGYRVSLPGLGTIFHTFRKERVGAGGFRKYQPPQYILKIKPSVNLQKALKELAVKYPDPKELPGNRGNATILRQGRPPEKRSAEEIAKKQPDPNRHPKTGRPAPSPRPNTRIWRRDFLAASGTRTPRGKKGTADNGGSGDHK